MGKVLTSLGKSNESSMGFTTKKCSKSFIFLRIWAADMGSISPAGSHQYEMLKKHKTDSLRKRHISGKP